MVCFGRCCTTFPVRFETDKRYKSQFLLVLNRFYASMDPWRNFEDFLLLPLLWQLLPPSKPKNKGIITKKVCKLGYSSRITSNEASIVAFEAEETMKLFDIFQNWPTNHGFNFIRIGMYTRGRNNMPQIFNGLLTKKALGELNVKIVR